MTATQAFSTHAGNPLDAGGFYCYLATPYDAAGNVDVETLAEYARRISVSGVAGVTCVASTCEGPYLNDTERQLVVDTVCRAVEGRVHVNVGVGAFSTRQVIDYAKQAKDSGASCLMLEMPQYFAVTFEAAYRHYEAVANAVDLPIRLYNLTQPTRFDFTPERILAMAKIEAIRSVKDASYDVSRVRDIQLLCGERYTVYCGFHYQALEGFRLGAKGWEVMMHPVFADRLVELYRALTMNPWSTESEKLYARLHPLFYCFTQSGVPPSIKAISQWTDLPMGCLRAPLEPLPETARLRLRELVRDLDVI